MGAGLLIGFAIAGALACPLLMLLGRRGIGPGCMLGRRSTDDEASASELRRRRQGLAQRISEFEAERTPEPLTR